MWYFYNFLCVSAAWMIACSFIHLPIKVTCANGFASGLVCSALLFLLSLVGIDLDLSVIFFLGFMWCIPITQKLDVKDRMILLFIAISVYSILSFCCVAINEYVHPLSAFLLSILIIFSFCLITVISSDWFPELNWRDYFLGENQESMQIQPIYVYILLGLCAFIELTLFCIITPIQPIHITIILTIISIFIYWVTLYLVCIMIDYRKRRLAILVEKNYREELQTYMSVIRSQRHDYNFHVQTLSALIKKGNLDECRSYLNQVVLDSSEMNNVLQVDDPAIAALIYGFQSQAEEHGIKLHIDIKNNLSNVVTSVYETNKIIGNLLQNAIDEVKLHEDKSYGIHLSILKRGEDCIIHVENKLDVHKDTTSYLENIYKPGYSRKNGHEGIGLSSVQNILKRHRGIVYSRIEEDTIHFVARIPMVL